MHWSELSEAALVGNIIDETQTYQEDDGVADHANVGKDELVFPKVREFRSVKSLGCDTRPEANVDNVLEEEIEDPERTEEVDQPRKGDGGAFSKGEELSLIHI